MSRNSLLPGIAFLFIVLTLSACGGSPRNSIDNIVVWHWLTDRDQAFLELANRYKQETGITVSFELYAPSDAYTQKVRASAQTETLPDIFGLLAEKRDFASFIKAGHVADLTADMEKDNGAWQNSLFDKALDVNRFLTGNQWGVNPGVYGVPVDVSNIQMLYNKDLFKKAGLDPERPPKTWAEFLEAGTALKAAGISGLVSGWGEVWMIDCFLSNYAMNIMGMDKYIATLRGEVPYTDPDWIKALGIFKEMTDAGILTPGIVAMVNKSAEQTFANSRAAFAFNGSWCVNVYKGMNPNLNYGAMLPPKISADNPMYIWGGSGTSFMVNEKSPNKEKAIAFLRWLTQKEQQSYLARETNNLPSNKKSLADITPILAQFADGMPNVTHPNVLPINEYSQVIEFLTKGAQSIIIGEKTPEQVAKEVQEIKEKKMAYEKAKKEREKVQ